MNILVACIGNIFQGDDAFGCEVAKVLMQRGPCQSVKVVDFGIRGLDLTYALLDAPELTIFVDAVSRGEAPGTLYIIEPDLDALDGQGMDKPGIDKPGIDAHSMDPLQVLRTAKSMGGRLGRILLVGCESADFGGAEGRMGLTPPVAAAVEEAANMVENLIAYELQKQLQEITR